MGAKGRVEAQPVSEDRNASPATAVAPPAGTRVAAELPAAPALPAAAAAVEVDFFMAYVAVYQPGTEYGPRLAPCWRCGAWALPCLEGCDAALDCPGCGPRCPHAAVDDDDRAEVRALRAALAIWSGFMGGERPSPLATILFRAANRVQLTTAESKAMWNRIDAARGGPLASTTAIDRRAGMEILNRAIRGEKAP